MTQPISFVVLSTGLDNFKEIRTALAADSRVQLLAGGNDVEQLYGEIVRLKPAAAIITLGLKLRAGNQAYSTAEYGIAEDRNHLRGATMLSPDLMLQSLRAGAREFLQLPISAEELKTVLDRVS